MEMNETQQRTLDFYKSLISYGSRDIECALEWIERAGEDVSEFAEYVSDWADETEIPLKRLDICGLALEFITCRARVPELTETLIANSICSTFDISPEEAGIILATIGEYDRYEAWNFLRAFTGSVLPEEDTDDAGENK